MYSPRTHFIKAFGGISILTAHRLTFPNQWKSNPFRPFKSGYPTLTRMGLAAHIRRQPTILSNNLFRCTVLVADGRAASSCRCRWLACAVIQARAHLDIAAGADATCRRIMPTGRADGPCRRGVPTGRADGACRRRVPMGCADGACRRSMPTEHAMLFSCVGHQDDL